MLSNKELVSKVEIEDGITELTYNIIHSGGCQCYKDCDCYKSRGEILWQEKMYSNGVVLKENGKPRLYKTKIGCLESKKVFLQNQNNHGI